MPLSNSRFITGEDNDPRNSANPVNALLTMLKRNGVKFVHWKSSIRLHKGVKGETDLDVLVERSHQTRFEIVLGQLGWRRVVSPVWGRYPGVEDWVLGDQLQERLFHLHVHYQLVTGVKYVKEITIDWGRELIADAVTDIDTGWPVPRAEHEFIIFLIRIWAKMPHLKRCVFHLRLRGAHGVLPTYLREECDFLLERCDPVKVGTLASRLLKLDEGYVVQCIQSVRDTGVYDGILQMAVRASSTISWRARESPLRTIYKALVNWMRMRVLQLWNKFVAPVQLRKTLPAGGVMIAIVGADGAGKSTLSKALLSWLSPKIDCHFLYLGSGDGPVSSLLSIKRLFARALAWPFRVVSGKRERQPQSNNTGMRTGVIWRTIRIIDVFIAWRRYRSLLRARRLCSKGSVVVVDRFPQDRVSGINDGPRLQDGRGFRWAARFEAACIAKCLQIGPDLLIRLDVSPDVASSRKPDHNRDMIVRKIEALNVVSYDRCHTVRLNADLSSAEVLAMARREVWSAI